MKQEERMVKLQRNEFRLGFSEIQFMGYFLHGQHEKLSTRT